MASFRSKIASLSSALMVVMVVLSMVHNANAEALSACTYDAASDAAQKCTRTLKKTDTLKITCATGATFKPGNFSAATDKICTTAYTSGTFTCPADSQKAFNDAVPSVGVKKEGVVVDITAPSTIKEKKTMVYGLCSTTDTNYLSIELEFSGAKTFAALVPSSLVAVVASIYVLTQ